MKLCKLYLNKTKFVIQLLYATVDLCYNTLHTQTTPLHEIMRLLGIDSIFVEGRHQILHSHSVPFLLGGLVRLGIMRRRRARLAMLQGVVGHVCEELLRRYGDEPRQPRVLSLEACGGQVVGHHAFGHRRVVLLELDCQFAEGAPSTPDVFVHWRLGNRNCCRNGRLTPLPMNSGQMSNTGMTDDDCQRNHIVKMYYTRRIKLIYFQRRVELL